MKRILIAVMLIATPAAAEDAYWPGHPTGYPTPDFADPATLEANRAYRAELQARLEQTGCFGDFLPVWAAAGCWRYFIPTASANLGGDQ